MHKFFNQPLNNNVKKNLIIRLGGWPFGDLKTTFKENEKTHTKISSRTR